MQQMVPRRLKQVISVRLLCAPCLQCAAGSCSVFVTNRRTAGLLADRVSKAVSPYY